MCTFLTATLLEYQKTVHLIIILSLTDISLTRSVFAIDYVCTHV